jgi:hypothetical protein
VLEGKVIGRCMQRHRHQEFIRFLNALEAEVPVGSRGGRVNADAVKRVRLRVEFAAQ